MDISADRPYKPGRNRRTRDRGTALPAAWQVRFRAGDNGSLADTNKNGTGGSAGMRPHERLEASLATCMTISARMALADLGLPAARRACGYAYTWSAKKATRFGDELVLDPRLTAHQPTVMDAIERSPVRATLSKQLIFEMA